ncbi:MAG TPA: glycosyltransferase family 1 protein [Thermoanaerobaculia bacterium]|nr:glycosyltransferase family 1 protein [Thermoanaerobaculia bacterium]
MTLTIGIDCRKVFDFGIGTYIRGLLHAYRDLVTDEELVLFGPESLRDIVPGNDERFTLVEETASHYSIEELAALERQLERHPVDVFHAPHYVTPFGKTKMVVTIHDLIHLQYPPRNPLAVIYARWMIGRAVRSSRQILTPSAAVAREIEKCFSRARGKVTVTPNGIDAALFATPDPGSDQEFLSRSGLRRGEYLLYVGNDKPHKNVDLLMRAWRGVVSEGGEKTLVLAGGDFNRFASVPGVRVAGFLSDRHLRSAYRGAMALVLPSLYEGFGLPILEAMAAGTPVVISDGGALPEVAGDAALMFVLSDAHGLSKALLRVISDEALRASLRQKGLDRVRQFSWEATARKTLEVYRAASLA